MFNEGATGTATAPSVSSTLTSALMQLIPLREGGLGGLVESFKSNGLGEVITSWVGPGPKLPITPEQVQAVLGFEFVRQVATKAGLPEDLASSQIASVLPEVISHLSEGKLPEGIMHKAVDFLKAKFQ